jgi:hypothetical protein
MLKNLRDIAIKIGAIIFFIIVFLAFGYLRALFSFADCPPGGHINMSFGSIIASGFGITVCTVPPTPKP